jgi:bacterioferritin
MMASISPIQKASEKLKKMMHVATANEMQVAIQYMWQHVTAVGVKGISVANQFKMTAITEMKHAERIADRLFYLGGMPSIDPSDITIGKDLKEFLELDAKAEADTIKLYKEIIELATKEDDVTTAFMFKSILEDEEAHHDLFTTMLEEV